MQWKQYIPTQRRVRKEGISSGMGKRLRGLHANESKKFILIGEEPQNASLSLFSCTCRNAFHFYFPLLGSSGLRYIWVNLYHRITVCLYMCMHMKQNTYDYTVNTWFQQRTRQGRVTVVSKQLCSSSYVWIIDSNASGSLIVPFAGANTGAGERSHLHMRLRAALRAEKSRVIAKVCWFYY